MKRVLIIDDSEFDRRMITRAMKHADNTLRFIEMDGGRRIIETMSSVKPNLVLLDIRMPGFNGFDVLKLIKEDEEFCDCKVIMISGSNGEDDKSRASRHGASAYYTKPHSQLEYFDIAREIHDRYLVEAI